MPGGQHEPSTLRARASASSLQAAGQQRRQLDELDDRELEELNEDIRRERLRLDGPEVQRTVEDDYEELLSMPIAKALQSRRPSQSSLKTYLPSSPSSTSLASFHYPDDAPAAPVRASTSTSASRSTSPLPASNIPRPQKSRSVSPDAVQAVPQKRRPSAGPDERADWEVLQVAKPKAVRTPNGSLSGTSAVRRPSTKTPTAPRTGPVKFPPSHGPPAPTLATNVRPRVRAQTQTSRVMAPRRSEPLPSTTTPRKAPPARLRSVSTTTKRRPLQTATSRYDDGDDDEEGPLPPWTSPAVSLYRSEGGRLESSGRPDELVLPAVARKLEAERLKRESQAGLINQYGPDGTPMGAISVAARRQQQQGEQDEQQQLPSPPPTPTPADFEPELFNVDRRSSRRSSRRQSRRASHAAAEEPATPSLKYAADPASKEAKLDGPAPERKADPDADSAGCCSCTIS